jgi:hypothetical protein
MTDDDELIDRCAAESLRLLERNLGPQGILAATPGEASEARRYTRVFGRDAAVCVLAMAGSGVPALEDGAIASLDALAQAQARNGQIPKYVERGAEPDFWYLGCIDATLWWLIAVDHLRCRGTPVERWQRHIERAIAWLLAQEHPRFLLVQQNEASDWADIMPRSGFVLYTNALWHRVKRLYGLPEADATQRHANHLLHPFGHDLPEYRRTRLLQHYARRCRRNPGLYLSFVNLSFAGDEGDTFGNLLAVLCGLAGDAMAHQVVKALRAAQADQPFAMRTVIRPITSGDDLWRAYMGRHNQNHPHQYHNGGIWPFVGGFWVLVLASLGLRELAREQLVALARANARDGWRFTEWFHGVTLEPMGMAGQSWNAAMFLVARRAVETGESAF